ncbi:hypothetical protein KUCAC02_014444 [Chaenocephalus aceratus]|uniref:Uncharacterized protein n=1 Tax=Chaenocephalus aceratus TaxID=36190 RepID=A0ACB9WEK7_CHAAC|nr:hypothetical protein KUCAC02_014444 [Chaenocephalus aceratus]
MKNKLNYCKSSKILNNSLLCMLQAKMKGMRCNCYFFPIDCLSCWVVMQFFSYYCCFDICMFL